MQNNEEAKKGACRAAFEDELQRREPHAKLNFRLRKDGGEYTSTFTEFDWQMWQAAWSIALNRFYKTSLTAQDVQGEVVKILQKLKSYNEDCGNHRINYRPHDHIFYIEKALAILTNGVS